MDLEQLDIIIYKMITFGFLWANQWNDHRFITVIIEIKEDMKLSSRSDERGTPTFFLSGKKSNVRDLNKWKAEIDAILGWKITRASYRLSSA
jgi:hypothetical protein